MAVARADDLQSFPQPKSLKQWQLVGERLTAAFIITAKGTTIATTITCFSNVIPLNADSCSPRSAA